MVLTKFRCLVCGRVTEPEPEWADDITLEKLAEDFDLSVSQVKRILKKHYFDVFCHFDAK